LAFVLIVIALVVLDTKGVVANGSSTNMGPVQLGQAPLKAHCVPLAQVKVQFPPGQLSLPLEILLILTIHDPLMHHGSACWE